jgi:hypothetical protein
MNQQTVQQTNEDNSFELRRRAARIAELVAALETIAKETGPVSDGPGTIATIGRIARAAIAKAKA